MPNRTESPRPPAIARLLQLVPDLPHEAVKAVARNLADEVRAGSPPPDDWASELRVRVAERQRSRLRSVINATGVVLHTNLGRAPLSARAAAAVSEIAHGWANVELDLSTGERGERLVGVRERLSGLVGAPDALAVNNNAAAVLLVLTALAHGREVVVSRGQLVEIGGSFRIPDVIAAGGAKLVEVGTTNRTRVGDYAKAIGPNTAALLWVHPSNFRVEGFTESADRAKLYALAKERGVPLLEDLGSGALIEGLGEPTVAESLATADVVTFSGDKLLGGPQAGLVAGRADLVAAARKHPLYRALRLDRLVLAALEATLIDYECGEPPPTVGLLSTPLSTLKRRAVEWAEALAAGGLDARCTSGKSLAGGGSTPGRELPTWLLTVGKVQADAATAHLRAASPPVIARIVDGRLAFDPRTVLPNEETALLAAILAAAGACQTR